MEDLTGPASAGGESKDEDVLTIEVDITGFVRQWLEAKERSDE